MIGASLCPGLKYGEVIGWGPGEAIHTVFGVTSNRLGWPNRSARISPFGLPGAKDVQSGPFDAQLRGGEILSSGFDDRVLMCRWIVDEDHFAGARFVCDARGVFRYFGGFF